MEKRRRIWQLSARESIASRQLKSVDIAALTQGHASGIPQECPRFGPWPLAGDGIQACRSNFMGGLGAQGGALTQDQTLPTRGRGLFGKLLGGLPSLENQRKDGGTDGVPESSWQANVVLLKDVFVNTRGEVFNATHRFVFGDQEAVASPLIQGYREGTQVVLAEKVVNLGLPAAHHGSSALSELMHRLPLLLHLSSFMPLLKGAQFLLGEHKMLHSALGDFLGITPWERLLKLPRSDSHLVFVRQYIQPLNTMSDLSLWRTVRRSFLFPETGLPIFNPDWTLRLTQGVPQGIPKASAEASDSYQEGALPAPGPGLTLGIPKDWVVVYAVPGAAMEVQLDVERSELVFLPFKFMEELVRSQFWSDRVVSFPGYRTKSKARALFRRAAVLIATPGSALDYLPFMPAGSVLVLLDPSAQKQGIPDSQASGYKDAGSTLELGQRITAFAAACDMRVLSVACSQSTSAGGEVFPGVVCPKKSTQDALAEVADLLWGSPDLPGHKWRRGLRHTLPGATIGFHRKNVSLFKEWGECVSSKGHWGLNPEPRTLAWGAEWLEVAPSMCDTTFLSGDKADSLAEAWGQLERARRRRSLTAEGEEERRRLESEWKVRPGLKYQWTVPEGSCPSPGSGSSNSLAGLLGASLASPSSSPSWKSFDPAEFCEMLGDKKKLLFLGDSLTDQFVTAAAFNLLKFETQPLRKSAVRKVVPHECEEWLESQGQRGNQVSCFQFHFNFCPGLQLTYMRNNRLRAFTNIDSIDNHHRCYFTPWATNMRPLLDDADVIIFNRGAHFTPSEHYGQELAATSRLLRERHPKKLLVYRSTVPGHAECITHEVPLAQPQDPATLPPNFHWGEFKHQNGVAREIMDDLGIAFLDVYPMTSLRADGHKGITKVGERVFLDCLHYCNPGPADGWVEHLFNSLQRLL